MSKYFDGEILSAYEDLNKEFEYKKENTKLQQQIIELQKQLEETKQTGSYQVMLMCQKENILLKQQLKEK